MRRKYKTYAINRAGRHSREEVLNAVKVFHERTGMPCTVADVATETGLSRTNAYYHLKTLHAQGLIHWQPPKSRTILPV